MINYTDMETILNILKITIGIVCGLFLLTILLTEFHFINQRVKQFVQVYMLATSRAWI